VKDRYWWWFAFDCSIGEPLRQQETFQTRV